MATTTIDRYANAPETHEARQETGGRGPGRGKAETEIRAAARRKGLTMKELADRMAVSIGYLSQIATGKRPWTTAMRRRRRPSWGRYPDRESSTGRAR